jgi:Asp-tRNA(Asn)/Glu-tRNA(Gln) amidotransferase A subunit family amidase
MEQTEPMNLLGNPALVVPDPLKDRSVPVTGLQLVGRNFSEADLLNAGRLIEEKVGTGMSHRKRSS